MAGLERFWNDPFLSLKGTHPPAQGKPGGAQRGRGATLGSRPPQALER